jgi:hypothetical protein
MRHGCRSSKRKAGRGLRDAVMILRSWPGYFASALLIVLPGSAASQLVAPPAVVPPSYAPDSLVAAVRGSGFRFVASVAGHSPASARYAGRAPFITRLRLDSALQVPPSVARLAGRSLTILARDTLLLPVGRRFVFVAAGISLGSGLLLHAKAVVPIDSMSQAGAVAMMIARADTLARHRTIGEHVRRSDATLLGTVLEVTDSSAATAQYAIGGEHQPMWGQARVRVNAMYLPPPRRGETEVYVLFPRSRDVAYRYAPRLRAGDQRVIVARSVQRLLSDAAAAGVSAPIYFVIAPLDVLPASDSMIVRLALTPP